jgi:hypothetical protein
MPISAPPSGRRAAAERLRSSAEEFGIRYRPLVTPAAAFVLAASTLAPQEGGGQEPKAYRLAGLRTGFCVQLLLDAATVQKALPEGYRPLAATQATELHPAVSGVVKAQPEFASWTPSRLCLYALDTLQTEDFTVADKKGRKPLLFGVWTAAAAEVVGGGRREVALLVLSNNERLIHSAKSAGAQVRQAKLVVGKVVPGEEDTVVVPAEHRFQVNVGKTVVTWDGRASSDSTRTTGQVEIAWAAAPGRRGPARGRLVLRPGWSRGMVGSFRVVGKDDVAKALKASPIHFVGPQYEQGGGTLQLGGSARQ